MTTVKKSKRLQTVNWNDRKLSSWNKQISFWSQVSTKTPTYEWRKTCRAKSFVSCRNLSFGRPMKQKHFPESVWNREKVLLLNLSGLFLSHDKEQDWKADTNVNRKLWSSDTWLTLARSLVDLNDTSPKECQKGNTNTRRISMKNH